MGNEDEENSQKKRLDGEALKGFLDQATKRKNTPVAKDLVVLKHVETKKQEVSRETKELAKSLGVQLKIEESSDKLSNEELIVLEAFEKKRLFLPRIAIIVNQSRVMMGMEGLKKEELETYLNSLIKKGFLESETVNERIVYIITEKGRERIQ